MKYLMPDYPPVLEIAPEMKISSSDSQPSGICRFSFLLPALPRAQEIPKGERNSFENYLNGMIPRVKKTICMLCNGKCVQGEADANVKE